MTTLATGSRVGAVTRHGGLQFSDYCYLCAVAIAALVTIDPWGRGSIDTPGLASNVVMKHLALPVSMLALLLTLVGRRMRVPRPRSGALRPLLIAAWPLVALALVITAGSAYARFFAGIQNTFLVLGLYMLVGTIVGGTMVRESSAPDALVRGYFGILVVAAIITGGYMIARQGYHELVHLVVPMAAFAFLGARRAAVRWTGLVAFLLLAWFSNKYTSYLVALLTGAYVVLAVTFARMQARPLLHRVTAVYWVCALGIASAGIIGLLALHSTSNLPTGNPEYRLHTYAAAWERFIESPWWGSLFATEAVEKFTLYQIGTGHQVLPTHSDVLDLLAHGGILAALLWLGGLVRAARIARHGLLRPQDLGDPRAPYAHTLALMSLAAVIVYTFNPILLQPAKAYLVWSNLGLLLGLSLRDPAERR